MPNSTKVKRQVRKRMAETGESYCGALRQILKAKAAAAPAPKADR